MSGRKTIDIRALHCPQCGAPAQVHPGEDAYHCRFCNTSFLIERPMAAPPPVPPIAPPVRVYTPPPHPAPMRVVDFDLPRRTSNPLVSIMVTVAIFGAVGVMVAWVVKNGNPFSSWNGRAPLVCSGNDRIIVDRVTAHFDKGIAIDASGNCWVVCKDCKVEAPIVVRARENASVHFDHGNANGTTFAEVTDNADVSIDHTKTTGVTKEPDNSSPFGKPEWPSSGPFVCGRMNQGGEFKNVKVKVTSGAAIVASINCHIKLSNCTIEGPVGLLLNDNADVELDDCQVHATNGVIARANGSLVIEGGSFVGTDHAGLLEDNASLHAHGAKVEGSKSASGNAEYNIEN